MSPKHPEALDQILQLSEQRELDALDLQLLLEHAAFQIGRFLVLIQQGGERINTCREQADIGKESVLASQSHIDASIGLQRAAGFDSDASRSARKAFQRTMVARRELDGHAQAFAGVSQQLNSAGDLSNRESDVRSTLSRITNDSDTADALGRMGMLQNQCKLTTERTTAYIAARDQETDAVETAQKSLEEADSALIPPESDPADPARILKKMIETLAETSKNMAELPAGVQSLNALLAMVPTDVETLNQMLGHWQGTAPMPASLGGILGEIMEKSGALAAPITPEKAEEEAGKVALSKTIIEKVSQMTTESQNLGTQIKLRFRRTIDSLKSYLRRGGS